MARFLQTISATDEDDPNDPGQVSGPTSLGQTFGRTPRVATPLGGTLKAPSVQGASNRVVSAPKVAGVKAAPLTAEAEHRILGLNTTSRQTPAQAADQAAFDRKMGFQKTTGEVSVATKILANRADRLAKDPYDLDYGTGGFGSDYEKAQVKQYDQRNTIGTLTMKAPAVTPPAPAAGTGPLTPLRYPPTKEPAPSLPTTVYQAPASTEAAATSTPSTAAAPSSLPSPDVTPAGPIALTPNPPVAPQPTPVEGGGGKALASGVSNSQAAGFTTPTKDKPIPETPTTPVMNVDEYDTRKNQFAGFK